MAYDVNLVLDSGQTVTADGNNDYIEVEGGAFVIARILTGAMTGAGTTCDIRLQYSPDNGSNYYMAGKFQQLGPTNDNAPIAIVAYIPPPATVGDRVRVRLNYDVAGASPSYAITKAWLEPLMSLGSPTVDILQTEGLCARLASV